MITEQKDLKLNGKIVFERLTVEANFKRVPKPFFEKEACFLFLKKGAFHFRTPTQLLTFNEGDGMLAKCGNYFMEDTNLQPTAEHKTVSMVGAFFYPDMVKGFFDSDLSIEPFQRKYDTLKLNIEPMMKLFIDSIDFILDNPAIADENLIINKLKELLLLLSKGENAQSVSDFVNSLFEPFQYDFKDIIQQNLYANLSLPEFAHLCNMSLATFKRKFLEVYQESPAKYFLQKKLEKAAGYLAFESKPISEIAFDLGFESASNFNKAFKKQFGCSPTIYRMSQKDK
jgi:AraC family transcriptional regulator, exoenzyme S synthesis regulatory protein ExsA